MKKYLFLMLMAISTSSQSTVIINEVNIGGDDYFELFNYSTTDVTLDGYSALIRDSIGSANFTFDLSGISLSANSGVTIVAELPQAGEVGTGANIMWSHTRNLSLSILDGGTLVDFWAHGSALYGAEAGTTFSPDPLSLITSVTDATTYQRVDVSNSGMNFFASDWTAAAASRGLENANQVYAVPAVPEPTSIALLGLGIAALGFSRKKKSA